MAVGSLSPFFVQINYRSTYGEHVMTIPLKGWTPGVDQGDLDLQGGGTAAADTALELFVDKLAEFFPGTVDFYSWTIFSQPTPSDPALPVMGLAITQAGLNVTAANTKAVQATFTFRCDDSSLFKIVLLDMNNGNSFEKITLGSLSVEAADFVSYIVGDTSPFQSRLNGRPLYFRQISYTMNEKLRRSYHMD